MAIDIQKIARQVTAPISTAAQSLAKAASQAYTSADIALGGYLPGGVPPKKTVAEAYKAVDIKLGGILPGGVPITKPTPTPKPSGVSVTIQPTATITTPSGVTTTAAPTPSGDIKITTTTPTGQVTTTTVKPTTGMIPVSIPSVPVSPTKVPTAPAVIPTTPLQIPAIPPPQPQLKPIPSPTLPISYYSPTSVAAMVALAGSKEAAKRMIKYFATHKPPTEFTAELITGEKKITDIPAYFKSLVKKGIIKEEELPTIKEITLGVLEAGEEAWGKTRAPTLPSTYQKALLPEEERRLLMEEQADPFGRGILRGLQTYSRIYETKKDIEKNMPAFEKLVPDINKAGEEQNKIASQINTIADKQNSLVNEANKFNQQLENVKNQQTSINQDINSLNERARAGTISQAEYDKKYNSYSSKFNEFTKSFETYNDKYENTANTFQSLAKEYDTLKIDYDKKAQEMQTLLSKPEAQAILKYENIGTVAKDFITTKPSEFKKAVVFGGSSAIELYTYSTPLAILSGAEMFAAGGQKLIKGERPWAGVGEIALGGLMLVPYASKFIKPAVRAAPPTAVSKIVSTVGKVGGVGIGLTVGGLEAYSTYRVTGDIPAGIYSGVGALGGLFGPRIVQREMRVYTGLEPVKTKQPAKTLIGGPGKGVERIGEMAFKVKAGEQLRIYQPRGVVSYDIGAKGAGELRAPGILRPIYRQWQVDIKSVLGKLGIEYAPTPIYTPAAKVITGFGEGAERIITAAEKQEGYQKAFKLLVKEGLAPEQAQVYLRYTSPKDIISMVKLKGIRTIASEFEQTDWLGTKETFGVKKFVPYTNPLTGKIEYVQTTGVEMPKITWTKFVKGGEFRAPETLGEFLGKGFEVPAGAKISPPSIITSVIQKVGDTSLAARLIGKTPEQIQALKIEAEKVKKGFPTEYYIERTQEIKPKGIVKTEVKWEALRKTGEKIFGEEIQKTRRVIGETPVEIEMKAQAITERWLKGGELQERTFQISKPETRYPIKPEEATRIEYLREVIQPTGTKEFGIRKMKLGGEVITSKQLAKLPFEEIVIYKGGVPIEERGYTVIKRLPGYQEGFEGITKEIWKLESGKLAGKGGVGLTLEGGKLGVDTEAYRLVSEEAVDKITGIRPAPSPMIYEAAPLKPLKQITFYTDKGPVVFKSKWTASGLLELTPKEGGPKLYFGDFEKIARVSKPMKPFPETTITPTDITSIDDLREIKGTESLTKSLTKMSPDAQSFYINQIKAQAMSTGRLPDNLKDLPKYSGKMQQVYNVLSRDIQQKVLPIFKEEISGRARELLGGRIEQIARPEIPLKDVLKISKEVVRGPIPLPSISITTAEIPAVKIGEIIRPVLAPVIAPVTFTTFAPSVVPETRLGIVPTLVPKIAPEIGIVPSITPTLTPVTEPVLEPSMQPVVQPIVQPIIQPIIQPIVQPVIQPVIQPTPIITPGIIQPTPTIIPGFLWFPEEILGRKRKKKLKRKAGYEVAVRQRGRFRPLTPYAYPREEAMAIGAKRVLGTARATFKITPSLRPVRETGQRISPLTIQEFFRAPKGREPGVFVQREAKRITSPGEKREITRVGIATRLARQALGLSKRKAATTSSRVLSLSTPKAKKSKFKFI